MASGISLPMHVLEALSLLLLLLLPLFHRLLLRLRHFLLYLFPVPSALPRKLKLDVPYIAAPDVN